ncbi:hypothetical protein [Tahibacter sp.]|uniref:hypothetical protein n=1 Tax=Tahibacter sp. TaxID=2056211 RepID=UPI0028C4C1E1|nr:hypothetical protein [Tahibacter sp.]
MLNDLKLSADGNGWGKTDSGRLVRLNDGEVHHFDSTSAFGGRRYASLWALMPDGGVVAQISSNDECALHRYSKTGAMRWRGGPCGIVTAASDGTLWISGFDPYETGTLTHLDIDGRVIALADPSVPPDLVGEFAWSRRLFAGPDGGLLHVGTVPADGPGLRHAVIVALDRDGRRRWRWQSAESWANSGGEVLILDDGDIVLAGTARHPDSGTPVAPVELQVARVSADGQQRWIKHSVGLVSGGAGTLFGQRDGSIRLLTGGPTFGAMPTLWNLRADGSTAWDISVPMTSIAQFAETPDGDTLLLGENTQLSNDPRRFLRIAPDGQVRIDRGVANGYALGINNALYQIGPTPLGPVARLTENGERVATDYSGATLPTEMDVEDTATGNDGSEFVLSVDRTVGSRRAPHFTTSRVAPDGTIVWQRDRDARLDHGVITANARRVCTFTRRDYDNGRYGGHAECLDAATGALIWEREIVDHIGDTVGAALSPGSDTLLVGHCLGGSIGHTIELLSAEGRSLRQTYGGEYPVRMSASPSGDLALVFSNSDQGTAAASVYGPDAQLRYGVDGNVTGLLRPAAAVAISGNGSIALFGTPVDAPSGTNVVTRSVYFTDPVRARSWVKRLPPLQENGENAQLSITDSTVYVAQRHSSGFDLSAQGARSRATRLYQLSQVDGSLRWQAESENLGTASHTMAPSADGLRLVSVHGARTRLHVEHYDSRDGARLAESWQHCIVRECDPVKLVNGSDGVSRLVIRAQMPDSGTNAAIFRQRGFDAPGVPTRLDQPGIAGAWWSPYANGEGITFDWLPASRTLFGAWFTYSTSGGNEPSELRWYTLQANAIAIGTRRLELPILETTGGNFDADPTVAPRRVGTAQVEFYDCSRGNLHYAFDAAVNDGRSGTITLSRLSPATQPCVLADGGTVPGVGAQPPANGFDAKLSGTWFDEATAGQGLQLTVQPNGVFFAPWFTFDPADAGNDAGRQHWFTLQGNLAEARDGVANLILVQTIGGTFDRVPTYNASAIGTATLRVQNCDRAELDYHFADESVAGAFRARSGMLRLTRAGGCAP